MWLTVQSLRFVNKLSSLVRWKLVPVFFTTVNLSIDPPPFPSPPRPYWHINRQDGRLKSSPISPLGPNWSWRSENVYCFYWFIVFMDPAQRVNAFVLKTWNNSILLCLRAFFPFSPNQNLLFLFFKIFPKTYLNFCYLQESRRCKTH